MSRLQLAWVILRGEVPVCLNGDDELRSLELELATAQREAARLAAALVARNLDPVTEAEEASETRSEIKDLDSSTF